MSGSNAGFTANSGTDDSYLLTDICASSIENTGWYSFTAIYTDTYTVTVSNLSCALNAGLEVGGLHGLCGGPYSSFNCMTVLEGNSGSFTASMTAGQHMWVVIDGMGGDVCGFDISVCGSICTADAGTMTVSENGVPTTSTVYLCEGGTDCVSIVSNNDYVLPLAQPGEIAEVGLALYTAPPTGSDPLTDPNFSGSYWVGGDFNDCNPSTYGLTGEYWFVPITMDDGVGGGNPNAVIAYDQNGDSCFALGTPIHVVYAMSDVATDTVTACDSLNWIDGNTYYASNNTATYSLMNVAGCDSVVTLNLTMNYSSTATDSHVACDSLTWIDGVTYYASNNTATYTLQNVALCDSVVTLDLTINTTPDITVTDNSPILTSNAVGASYQWFNCDSVSMAITGETNQSFTATTNGNYAVEVLENGCVDTSACIVVMGIGIIENSFASNVTVYPNPTLGEFTIDLGGIYGDVQVSINDVNGKLVKQSRTEQTRLLNVSLDKPAGIYFLKIISADQSAVIRIVKE